MNAAKATRPERAGPTDHVSPAQIQIVSNAAVHSPRLRWVDAVEKVENSAALQISRKTVFACRRFCERLSDAYEALWSPSCDSTCSLTSARAACTGGAEKFG
jgi:hypothetical protein